MRNPFRFAVCRSALIVALIATGAMVVFGSRAPASEVLIDPDHNSVSFNTYYPTFDQVAAKMADNSGLSSPLATGAAVPASDDAYPTHDTVPVNEYRSGKDTHPDLTFSLGGSYALSGMHYWNFNADNRADHPTGGTRETPGDGVASVDISISNTATGPFVPIGTYNLVQATGVDTYTGTTLALGQTVEAQYVSFHVNNNFAPAGDGGNYFGLAEVRFIGTATPEPATLSLCGIAAVGLLARRTRRR